MLAKMQWRIWTIATGVVWLAGLSNAQVDKTNTLSVGIARNVTAGGQTPVNFTSDADLSTLTSTVSVMLYDSISNWPICVIGNTSLSKLKDSFEIPTSVGPSGLYYRLAFIPGSSTDMYNITGSWPFGVPEYSNLFFLSGGTSAWSSAEAPDDENSYGLGHFFSAYLFSVAGAIPCSSYNCARDCSYRQLPYQDAWGSGQEWRTCLEACPDVTLNPKSLASIASATDGGGVPSPTTASALATPSDCDAADFLTPCGTKCCGTRQYCLNWKSCVSLGSDDTTTITSATQTSTGSASNIMESGSNSTPDPTPTSSTSSGAVAPGFTAPPMPVPAAIGLLLVLLR